MKLKVYSKKEKKEKPVYFELSENNNTIILSIVDKHGHQISGGEILSINQRGLFLNNAINGDIGLPLDKEYKIAIRTIF